MTKAAELVFIPSAGVGHLVSTVEIAKLMVSRHPHLSITVLIMKLPFDSKGADDYTHSLATSSDISQQRIKFINLPQATDFDTNSSRHAFRLQFVEAHKPYVKLAVAQLADSGTPLAGFVIDMFCTTMMDVADEFGVPTYMFYTSPAGFLGLLLHLEKLREEHGKDICEFRDSDTELAVPSFANPVPGRVLPTVLVDKEGATAFLNYARRYRETKGILVNSFIELESHALHSLCDGKTPPVYPVGPVMNLKREGEQLGAGKSQQKSDILGWLDEQPPSSVVFLCFGSMGAFNEEQVKEIAYALEQSGVRFLWSLRNPPPKGKVAAPSDYADPSGVLPEGFLHRTAGIGKVIGWAPQVAILAHPATGGFVSHCGWNSVLESLWYGVPIATWPVYGEQQLNAFEMVRELGLAVEVDMGYRREFSGENQVVVSAEKIGRGIREVMEQDSDVRKKVKQMSEKAKITLMEGGSSYTSLGRFIDHIFL